MNFEINPMRSIKHCGFGEKPLDESMMPASTISTPAALENSSHRIDRSAFKTSDFRLVEGLKTFIRYVLSYFKIKNAMPSTNQLDAEIRQLQSESTRQKSVGEWTKNNDILVTTNAAETNAWKLELIKSAKHSLEISGSICGGEVFREALKAIEERLDAQSIGNKKPDLKVHLLTTPDLLEKADKDLLKHLRKKYPDNFNCIITHFEFSNFYRVENHVKLVVVDEKRYAIGGTNYQDNMTREADPNVPSKSIINNVLGAGSADMDVVGQGVEMAAVMRREFFKLYAMLEYKENSKAASLINHYFEVPINSEAIAKLDQHEALIKDVEVKAVAGYAKASENNCTAEYAKLIRKANKKATIAHMYFDPPKQIKEALHSLQELDNPVAIDILTSGVHSSAPLANQFYGYANRNYYMSLLKNKIKGQPVAHTTVNTYRNGKNIIHMKTVVIERIGENKKGAFKENLSTVGSFNWGGKCEHDFELGVVIKSDEVANKFLEMIKNNKAKSVPITQEEIDAFEPRSLKGLIGKLESVLFPRLVG